MPAAFLGFCSVLDTMRTPYERKSKNVNVSEPSPARSASAIARSLKTRSASAIARSLHNGRSHQRNERERHSPPISRVRARPGPHDREKLVFAPGPGSAAALGQRRNESVQGRLSGPRTTFLHHGYKLSEVRQGRRQTQ